MFAELVAGETERLRLLFLAVDRADEGAALGGEDGLRVLGVAELSATVGIAPGLDDAPRGVDGVEAMLGVGGEGSANGWSFATTASLLLSASYWKTATSPVR